MLKPLSLLNKAAVVTTDNGIGTVTELFFDQRDWIVRYLAVDIGSWLFGRTTLISPAAVRTMEWDKRKINLDLTRKQIEKSPAIDIRKPISRQRELEIFTFYGWPAYWPASGFTAVPPGPPPEYPLQPIRSMEEELATPAEHFEDPHLRRLAEARGCRLQAADGEAGKIADFLVDAADWAIRYLVVATVPKGGRVVVPTDRLGHPRWRERQLSTNLSREQIEKAPCYDPEEVSSDEQEKKLHRYFGGH